MQVVCELLGDWYAPCKLKISLGVFVREKAHCGHYKTPHNIVPSIHICQSKVISQIILPSFLCNIYILWRELTCNIYRWMLSNKQSIICLLTLVTFTWSVAVFLNIITLETRWALLTGLCHTMGTLLFSMWIHSLYIFECLYIIKFMIFHSSVIS